MSALKNYYKACTRAAIAVENNDKAEELAALELVKTTWSELQKEDPRLAKFLTQTGIDPPK